MPHKRYKHQDFAGDNKLCEEKNRHKRRQNKMKRQQKGKQADRAKGGK